MNMEPIVNRVAESEILVYNLEALWDGQPVVELDLAPFLYKGLVLREKEFREQMKAHDWKAYAGRHVAVFCSADAIVPTWAYMLAGSKLQGLARSVAFGRAADLVREHFVRAIEAEDWLAYTDRIVVVKGCGSKIVPTGAYLLATMKLQNVARKLMYGEPCSSVPIWRRPAQETRTQTPAVAARPALPGADRRAL